MSSESPGNIGKREMLNLKKPNQMSGISPNPGDNNTVKCLPILPSPLQQRHSPSKTTKRNSNPSNVIRPPQHHHLHHPLLLLLLLLNLVPYAAANGFCSPLLCSCQVIFQPSLTTHPSYPSPCCHNDTDVAGGDSKLFKPRLPNDAGRTRKSSENPQPCSKRSSIRYPGPIVLGKHYENREMTTYFQLMRLSLGCTHFLRSLT